MATLNEAIATHLKWKIEPLTDTIRNGWIQYSLIGPQGIEIYRGWYPEQASKSTVLDQIAAGYRVIDYEHEDSTALELLKTMDAALSYVPSTQQWQVDNYMTESPTMFTDASAARAICKAYAAVNGIEWKEGGDDGDTQ